MQLCKEQNSILLFTQLHVTGIELKCTINFPPLFHTLYCCYISKTTLQQSLTISMTIHVLTVSTTVVKWSRGKWDKSPTITRLWNVSAFTGSAWRFTKYTACSNSVNMHCQRHCDIERWRQVQIHLHRMCDHTKYNTYGWPGRWLHKIPNSHQLLILLLIATITVIYIIPSHSFRST